MSKNIKKPIKPTRFGRLPESLRKTLKMARLQRDWSQTELGVNVGLPQMHISGIETGKIVPRFDTLLNLVRVLGYDLMLVPRSLIPLVQSLTREQHQGEEERPLYASDETSEERGPNDNDEEEV